jgi:hypothetical protein
MEKEEIQNMLLEVKEWVSVLEADLKPIAFECLLKQYSHIKNLNTEKSMDMPNESIKINTNLQENLERISKSTDIDLEKLRLQIDFQEDMPRLLFEPKHKVRKKIQVDALIIIGYLLKKAYNISEFYAPDVLKRSKINTDRLDHLSTNKEFIKFLSKNGKNIQVTFPGEKRAIELLKEITK